MKKEEKNYLSSKNFWIMIPLLVICAIIAGLFGEAISRIYFSEDPLLSYRNELDLSGLGGQNAGLIIRDAKKVVVNQDVKFSETINSVNPSLVGVFSEKNLSNLKTISNSASSSLIDSFVYYNLDEALFNGLIVTSDGWVMALLDENMISNFPEEYEKLIVIDNNRKIYKIDDFLILEKDGLAFFHLVDARNLAIKKNASRSDIFIGQSLLVINNRTTAYPSTLTSLRESGDLLNSESLDYNLSIDLPLEGLEGSFIFNLNGELVAFVNYQEKIIPAFSYNHYWRSLLEKSEFERPYLGLSYLDLSRLKIVSDFGEPLKGALIWSDDEIKKTVCKKR